jgi:hypothetical protein
MVIKIPAFQTLEKVNGYMKSLKPSRGWSACSPARVSHAAVFPSLGLASRTQRATSG